MPTTSPKARVKPGSTVLGRLFADMHDWPEDKRTGWNVVRELSKVGRELSKVGTVTDSPGIEPPRWFGKTVADWVTWMAQHWPQVNDFVGVRAMERLGLVSLEHNDTYVLAMVSGLGDRTDEQARITALREDAELRETLLWRVFEVEGGGEVSLANVDKISHPNAGWGETFRVLVADGPLPRDRVLTSCLQALGRDFSAYRAAWFAQTYTSLLPTPHEAAAAQKLIRELLRASAPATVSFAMRYLTIVDKAGLLDDEAYVRHCAAAMAVPTKTAPIAAIALTAKAAGRHPDLAQEVAEAVTYGLEHPHRDVQSRALAVLRSLDARAAVAPRVDLLEPSVRRVATDWLGHTPTPQAGRPSPSLQPMTDPTVREPTRADRTTIERAAVLLAGSTDPWEIEQLLAALACTVPNLASRVVSCVFVEVRQPCGTR
jgi:hypothetical protein